MKQIATVLMVCLMIVSLSLSTFAHSGRTDSAGGHKDNKNASGLGYYHYHCGGNPPHLHSNGECPYSTSSSATTSSAQPSSNTATSQSPTQLPSDSTASQPAGTAAVLAQADQEVVSKADAALKDARASSKASATVPVSEESELSLAAMQEMARIAKSYNMSLLVNHDVKANDAISIRLSISPENATQTIALGGSLNSNQAESTKAKFEKRYQNRIAVISMNQQGSFGMAVTIIAKVNLSGFDTQSLHIYSYDSNSNTITALDEGRYSIDQNGFIHITTSLGGDIIIADGSWVK